MFVINPISLVHIIYKNEENWKTGMISNHLPIHQDNAPPLALACVGLSVDPNERNIGSWLERILVFFRAAVPPGEPFAPNVAVFTMENHTIRQKLWKSPPFGNF